MTQQEETLTVEDVAAELRVHADTVRTWIRTGELDAVDVGREYRIYRADLDEFIKNRRTGRKKHKD